MRYALTFTIIAMQANDKKKVACPLFTPAVMLYDAALLLTPWSPHSSYDPRKYKELQNVIGYKK